MAAPERAPGVDHLGDDSHHVPHAFSDRLLVTCNGHGPTTRQHGTRLIVRNGAGDVDGGCLGTRPMATVNPLRVVPLRSSARGAALLRRIVAPTWSFGSGRGLGGNPGSNVEETIETTRASAAAMRCVARDAVQHLSASARLLSNVECRLLQEAGRSGRRSSGRRRSSRTRGADRASGAHCRAVNGGGCRSRALPEALVRSEGGTIGDPAHARRVGGRMASFEAPSGVFRMNRQKYRHCRDIMC